MPETDYSLWPVGIVLSALQNREDAPKLGNEGAPDAWLEMSPQVAEGLQGIGVGDDVILVTWLHKAHRDILKVNPNGDKDRPSTGVFGPRRHHGQAPSFIVPAGPALDHMAENHAEAADEPGLRTAPRRSLRDIYS